MKNITLKDVALEAGVAKSVASVVLRGLPESNKYLQKTRQRVIDAAEKLQYKPNFFASQLMPGKQKILVLCLRCLQDSYASVIARSFEECAYENGFKVLLSVQHGGGDAMEFSRDVVGRHGLRNAAYIGDADTELQENLVQDGVNVVLIGRKSDNPKVSTVTADNYNGGRTAAKHIYDQGITKVWVFNWLLAGMDNGSMVLDWDGRIAGIKDYAREHGLPEPMVHGFTGGQIAIHEAYEQIKQLLHNSQDVEAIMANDTLAHAAIAALDESGLRAGRDVAVVGYDDNWYSSLTIPPLTTVRQPKISMGRIAADLLIKANSSDSFDPQKIVLPTEFIVRKSSFIQKRP